MDGDRLIGKVGEGEAGYVGGHNFLERRLVAEGNEETTARHTIDPGDGNLADLRITNGRGKGELKVS